MYKNIQYYLKKYDIDKLTNAYFNKYHSNITDFYNNDFYLKYKKVTFGDYENKIKINIKNTINYLRKVKPKKVKFEDNCIFISHKYMSFNVDDSKENFIFLYKISDIIKNKKNINSFAFEFDTYSEMLSYLVADTFYNNEHIEDILVDFLYEATFFGNNEKHDINVKKEIDILLEREKEIKEKKTGKLVEFNYYKMLKKFNNYSDKKIKEIKKNDDLYNKSNVAKAEHLAQKSIIRYNNLAALFEIENVRKDIIKYMH